MALPILRYDFRQPDFAPSNLTERYRTSLEQATWAERNGFSYAVISEHHALPDGYLPSPLMVAAAITGRTSTLKVLIGALLMPLYDTVRLAEDLAVLDHISNGRVRTVAGLGYRDVEFDMYGINRRERGPYMEEQIQLLLEAWAGNLVDAHGRMVTITPRPGTDPRDFLYVGAATPIGARRAARLDLPFAPAIADPVLHNTYREECALLGRAPRHIMPGSTHGFLHVTEDPEKAWAEIGKYAVYEAVAYNREKPGSERSSVTVEGEDLDSIRRSGVYLIVTPDECVELAGSLGPEYPLVFHPLMGGLPPDLGWQSLELFASKVLPRLPSAGEASAAWPFPHGR